MPYFTLKINNCKLDMRVWKRFLTLLLDSTFNFFIKKIKIKNAITSQEIRTFLNCVRGSLPLSVGPRGSLRTKECYAFFSPNLRSIMTGVFWTPISWTQTLNIKPTLNYYAPLDVTWKARSTSCKEGHFGCSKGHRNCNYTMVVM